MHGYLRTTPSQAISGRHSTRLLTTDTPAIFTAVSDTVLCAAVSETALYTAVSDTTLCSAISDMALCAAVSETVLCAAVSDMVLFTAVSDTVLCAAISDTALYAAVNGRLSPPPSADGSLHRSQRTALCAAVSGGPLCRRQPTAPPSTDEPLSHHLEY